VQQCGAHVMTEPPSSDPIDTVQAATEITENKDRIKKKDKVRSAWISFVGRILSQAIGATTAIALGLMFVQRQQASSAAEDHQAAAAVSAPTMAHITPDARSLAVLPFQNFSGDSAADYVADGMTEALISTLSQNPRLRVVSRTSSMPYKQGGKSLRQIADELGVRWIVEGSYIRSDGRIRVTAQLIDATTDHHRWARSYDRKQADMLSVQADVATAIARDVGGALAPEDEQ
jgi:TolB-like protein